MRANLETEAENVNKHKMEIDFINTQFNNSVEEIAKQKEIISKQRSEIGMPARFEIILIYFLVNFFIVNNLTLNW